MGKKIINLGHFEPATRAMGPGLRTCLWVRGCSIHCPGCISQEYQERDPKGDIPLWRLLRKIRQAKEEHGIEGISFSGGEPFEQAPILSELAEAVHLLGLSTLAWSGYTLARLKSQRAPKGARDLLQHLDVLVDGPFVLAKRANDLPLRGSSNQCVHFLTDRYQPKDLSHPCLEVRLRGDQVVQTTGVVDYTKALAILDLLGLGHQTAMPR